MVCPESRLKESASLGGQAAGAGGGGAYSRVRSPYGRLLTSSSGLCCSVVGALQHALAQGQVPVVFCAMLLEVFSGHVLRRALLELHVSEAALFSRSLEEKQNLSIALVIILSLNIALAFCLIKSEQFV